MKPSSYLKIAYVRDRLTQELGEEIANQIADTMETALESVEEYCIKNLPNFNELGEVYNTVSVSEENATQDIKIKYDGADITEAHAKQISEILSNTYKGWEEDEQ